MALRVPGKASSVASAERFAVTAEIVSAITSSLVLEEVLANVAQRTAEALDVWECDIYDYRPAEELLVGQAFWERVCDPRNSSWIGSSHDLVLRPRFQPVLHDSHTVVIDVGDPALPEPDRARMERWGEKTCLVVPLVFRDEVIGCLELVEKRHPRRFSARQCELARTLAALAAVAIQNARLYASVELLAITDGLTSLFNHRHFYERLGQEIVRAQRYELPLSLLMIDIDDFKGFNDRFGHRHGDAVLRELAALLQVQTRQEIDTVARYGGEEFAVILPSTGIAGALRVGERLCNAIAGDTVERGLTAGPAAAADSDRRDLVGSPGAYTVAERIRDTIASKSFGSDEPPPVVTVSIGVASFPDQATTADGLVEEADRGLYEAKRIGKNRVGMTFSGA